MSTGKDALQTICSPCNDRVWGAIWLSIKTLLRSIIYTDIAQSTRNSRLTAFHVCVSLIKAFVFALTFAALPQTAAADSRLIMVTSDQCSHCQAWELSVGMVYDKSSYATTLPLTRVEIGSKMPGGVTLQKTVVGTPTFLIIRNGQEISRQHGYFDAEMFWWWLSEYVPE